ncbi:hydroxylase, partial [Salmonella enterica subsp. enterica serovar Typhimurium]|nr:hydroxylase [Salmonella enterica subsp. enterica serovar Typhimurium]
TSLPITGTVGIGHQPGLTGDDLAAAYTDALGREVRYEGITPESFGELIAPLFGPAAAPVVALYRALGSQSHNTIDRSSSAQEVLGIAPRP